MKITNVRKKEKLLVELYNLSKGKGDKAKEASEVITKIDYAFRLIGVFTGQDHEKIVNNLYFSKNNIISVGISKVSDKVFLQEKTLYLYRQRYCEAIEFIVDSQKINLNLLLDKSDY